MRSRHILFVFALLTYVFASGKNPFTIKTVVIDAGHGGKDPGASGPGKTNEKDVALLVALKLGEYIQENFPDVRVIYTRKTDVFLELHQRAEIANKAKADLFIAVHCNSSPNGEIYGTSTYILGLHRTEANLEVAKRENAVILLEDDRAKNYEFDPNTPEGHIIMSMKQNAFLDQSIDLASKVENQLENYAKRKSLGVKQAGFYVLYKTAMPSLLAEIGFISNPEEEKFLNSANGQDEIAEGLFNAFKDYKNEMEGNESAPATAVAESKTPAPVVKDTAPVKKPATIVPVAEIKKPVAEPIAPKTDTDIITLKSGDKIKRPAEHSGGGGITSIKAELKPEVKETVHVAEEIKTPVVKVDTEPKKPELKQPEPPKSDVKSTIAENKSTIPEVKPEVKNTTVPIPKPEVKTVPASVKVFSNRHPLVPDHKSESGVVFKIQLFSLKGPLKEYEKILKLFSVLAADDLPGGLTRYYGGSVKSFTEAKRLHALAISNGYKDAYIVGFKDGQRMGNEEIKTLLQQ